MYIIWGCLFFYCQVDYPVFINDLVSVELDSSDCKNRVYTTRYFARLAIGGVKLISDSFFPISDKIKKGFGIYQSPFLF